MEHKKQKKCEHELYRTWLMMRQRCNNPHATSAPWYHDIGIRVCERWEKDFWAFVEDMGPKPGPSYTLGRIDPDGDYEPDNCLWATRSEQMRNCRRGLGLTANQPRGIRPLCKPMPYKGRMVTVAQLTKELGLDEGFIRSRVQIGFTLEEAVEIPKHVHRTTWYADKKRAARN